MFAPRDPDEYLLDSERRVIRVRRHWAALAWDTFEAIALLAVCIMVSYLLPPQGYLIQNVLWYVALFVLLRFTYEVLIWWVERIVVTDKRILMTTGVFTTRVLMMPIGKVTDLTYKRTLMGRMLGYGTMIVESAGQIQALNQIEYLPKPERVFDAISALVFGQETDQRRPVGARSSRFSMMQARRIAQGKKAVG
ncbi:MAG TPA: PH domain-containing protein [Actinophytocola sp.]|uniref:PH domain-containing protein n=1 Tax=Actinophytocola sp. TaxID=1872138 RepID=UPI002DBCFDD2|nr:PH domain-containing protein [Actinophytocola sp.]HEU5469636.1 PH domain-containing protein [Actinophytocola sp.]